MLLKSVSSKPYIVRAIYEWCTDCGYDPQLVVFFHTSCILPTQFIDADNEVIFNINWQAIKNLLIEDDNVTFTASFDGGMTSQDIYIPMACIKGIYALQTADGMIFDINMQELANLENFAVNNDKKSQKPLLKRLK